MRSVNELCFWTPVDSRSRMRSLNEVCFWRTRAREWLSRWLVLENELWVRLSCASEWLALQKDSGSLDDSRKRRLALSQLSFREHSHTAHSLANTIHWESASHSALNESFRKHSWPSENGATEEVTLENELSEWDRVVCVCVCVCVRLNDWR